MNATIFTIGHSTQSRNELIDRLRMHGITALADVRSVPYSRRNPQFNREDLRLALKAQGVRYVFLGKELGARSEDECCYVSDKVSYQLLERTELFKSGVARVLEGARTYKVAMMCAEKDPLDCHRTILVARELARRGCNTQHILMDGSLESQSEALTRLVKQLRLDAAEDMFRSREMTFEEAYDRQAERIAYDRRAHRHAPVTQSEPV